MEDLNLNTLCKEHLKIKEKIRLLQLELDEVNLSILNFYDKLDEGSKTYQHNQYKIVTDYRCNRKVDLEKFKEACDNLIPSTVQLLKPTLNETAWKQFKKKFGSIADKVIEMGAIEENQGKTGVRVSL